MNLDIIELILKDFEPQTEEHERIKLYLQAHKSRCENYIAESTKYKERVALLQSTFRTIEVDLLADICRQIYK